MKVQKSPVTGIIYEDLTGDGIKDLLLAGNNYVTATQTTRYDAGIGSFLKGKGSGKFELLKNQMTGLYLDRDVRDLAKVGDKIFVIYNDNKQEVYGMRSTIK